MSLHSHFREGEPSPEEVHSPCPAQRVQLMAEMGRLRPGIPKVITLPPTAQKDQARCRVPLPATGDSSKPPSLTKSQTQLLRDTQKA